jgi:hypothetical protein
MCLSLLFFRPVNLAWWNLRYYPYFRWEVVGASGKVYALEENWMTPYHIHFTFHRYQYLIERDIYNHTQTDPDEERLVNGGLAGLRELPTVNRYDETLKRRTDEFLVRYFRNLNARGSRKHWLSRFEVPHHLQMRRTGDEYPVYDLQEPVQKVICRFVEEYHENKREVRLSDEVVYTLKVPSAASRTQIAVRSGPAPRD